jgi:N-acyl homoserine lactone hydrolase
MKLMTALAALLLAGTAQAQQAKPGAQVTLTRLNCGELRTPRDIAAFNDAHALDGVKRALVASCYLIRHGDEYLLWDAGYPLASRDAPESVFTKFPSVRDQLATLKVDPAKIGRIGVSHYHADHIGQAGDFPGATLLIGQADWDALKAVQPGGPPRMGAPDPKPLAHWLSGAGKAEPVTGDKDVFGDGSVVMIDLPGHTPGHHGLLVRLKNKGPVLLTGDVAHVTSNYETDGVPTFNTNRADSLASLDRFKATAGALKATVVIQHEPDDVAKLPAFPAAVD